MPNYRRAHLNGGTYFFTVSLYDRRAAFLTEPSVRRGLREGIERTRQTRPFVIDAWVLLPDHLHCIWTLPPDDSDYAARWSIIKRHVSQSCELPARRPPSASRRRRGESGIWQRRFWEHLIRDDGDLTRHLDYVHWNPLKHGCVNAVRDWPYSSFHRYVAQGVYPMGWGVVSDDEAGEYGEPAR